MFWKNYITLCNSIGKSPNGVCSELGFSTAVATKWKNGALPRDTTLKKIADYFNVSVDYLLKGENSIEKDPPLNSESLKDSPIDEMDEQEKTLLKLFRGTTQEGRMRIIQAVLNICDEVEITALNGKNYNSAG